MTVSAVAERVEEAPAAKLELTSTAALLFSANAAQYVIIGVTGVILARGLGPDGRGVYGLINETALIVAAFPGAALELAGIYLIGKRRYTLQTVFSNTLSWSLVLAALCLLLIPLVLLSGLTLFGMSSAEISVGLLGASMITVGDGSREYLLPLNRPVAYTGLTLIPPIIRLGGVVLIVLTVGLTIDRAATIWLISLAVLLVFTIATMMRHVSFRPRVNWKAMKAQVSFGSRSHFGWILQALNHRLDVFMIAVMVGTGGVGHYLVGVNLAELTWWVPLALGTVLFPKASAMDSESNFEMSAMACRRTLVVTMLAGLGLLLVAPTAIPLVYGGNFVPSVTIFLILLPSGLFYTIHKVLGSSLSAHGMPQATLYAGLISLPLTVGLNVLMIPRWGITGAAIASDIAYAVNAAVILVLFVRVSRLPLPKILLFNMSDFRAARDNLKTKVLDRLRKDDSKKEKDL
ncbi:MAG: polysaccharide biosynthesis C-terminal domain-containing protein [Chloroflexi bacterium]|nr:polysaccharide biosynthesis C-terminal domain-containing protein [Chloroflexota bacterium]MCI0782784.1 polysaccharide biosynthesis C-terminal domain-containing protein [Chloroflexota bacterium]MCI0813821.1 polysaccharide biosynthesis C-terminal domain-containing protein [Chloroflexota bacterium]MCI0817182.1 polysaccharide biosynthesis C-terminal domain-containing protein [Chloroflexota bacterium]MCI0820641.1 polysaccharide biosynthesis C-terminal domain-containing protein [Chloroflexota bact